MGTSSCQRATRSEILRTRRKLPSDEVELYTLGYHFPVLAHDHWAISSVATSREILRLVFLSR